ncbi:MAG: AMP-binding protein [Saprospiraceae bacterium]
MQYKEIFAESLRDPQGFWRRQAGRIEWFRPPNTILSRDEEGLDRWYADGVLNTCWLALDRHVRDGRGAQAAIHYDSPATQITQTITYRELLDETARFAGALRDLGIEKGDRVIIYMPMIPQAVIAMLACARLGAVHSVVFGGFAARELALRIDDARPKALLTASAGVEFDRIIPYQPIVEAALAEAAHAPHTCVVWQRNFYRWELREGRDCDWTVLSERATPAEHTPVAATDPLYVLYTSGTTGKPKGIVRDNGGHAVAMRFSMDIVYGAHPGDVFWAASDVGWVVGHSYIVYAPLITGCTTILYEGKPVRTPDAGAWWRVIQDYGVNIMFTAPTGFRAIKKEDPDGSLMRQYRLDSLRRLYLAGERCDAATLSWLLGLLDRPVIDHWWQTESGWPMLANPAGVELMEIRAGSSTVPMPGFDIRILDENAQEQPTGQEGAVAVRLPLPPGCLPTLWNNAAQFREAYLSAYPGYYFTGDGGYRDEDGYFYITGRIDDVINVAGHRLSTADMEEIVAAHPAVAECAVIGVDDGLKGQIPVGFVTLKQGASPEGVEAELIRMVRERLGAVACFKKAVIVQRLPKTRSGKILRKVMRAIANHKPWQMPGTIEDPGVLDEISQTISHELGK